eukprot:snap_masked-scaffold_20-processed-gene-5.72-mRNA-1 protein AED:0.29 eAED:0.29 QI:0/-1/0/1/-1/1/1/0/212
MNSHSELRTIKLDRGSSKELAVLDIYEEEARSAGTIENFGKYLRQKHRKYIWMLLAISCSFLCILITLTLLLTKKPWRSRHSARQHGTDYPTYTPSITPTYSPTVNPTFSPTQMPSFAPSIGPTFYPSFLPTAEPSASPTERFDFLCESAIPFDDTVFSFICADNNTAIICALGELGTMAPCENGCVCKDTEVSRFLCPESRDQCLNENSIL